MKTIINPLKKDWTQILMRPTKTVDDIEHTVNQIFNDVQKNKDEAVTKYTKLYDGVIVKTNINNTQHSSHKREEYCIVI